LVKKNRIRLKPKAIHTISTEIAILKRGEKNKAAFVIKGAYTIIDPIKPPKKNLRFRIFLFNIKQVNHNSMLLNKKFKSQIISKYKVNPSFPFSPKNGIT